MENVKELWGDLFAMDTSLAHCVSRDLSMTAGIADQFRLRFGGQRELLHQERRIGEVAHIPSPTSGCFLFYLITKDKYHHKNINIDDVKKCLVYLKNLCSSLGVKEVSMPRISCGLDRLRWEDVLPMIRDVFRGGDVTVNILTPPPRYRDMAVLGDSQALRFVTQHGCEFPAGCHHHGREIGLSKSGQRLRGLIEQLEQVPDNGLFDVLVFIGSNDLLDLCRVELPRALKLELRGKLGKLRATLDRKVKDNCRAVVLTIPPMPYLLMPTSPEDFKSAPYFISYLNTALKKLTTKRFHVLDLDKLLIRDGHIVEECFERTMGRNRREDRIHINRQGMELLKDALHSLPPFEA